MIRLIISAFISLSLITAASAQDVPVTAEEKAKIRSALVEIFQENPEIVIMAIQEFQSRRQMAAMLPKIEMYRGYLENDPDEPVIGNPDGDVTIVEFFDYRCGFCRRHFPQVMKLVAEDGNIRYMPKQFPILDRPGQDPVSRLASQAAIAAQKQGKFEEFHVAIMSEPGSVTEDAIYNVASRIGLDVIRLKSDMNDKLLDKKIENSLAIGQDIGFSGTPGYIIGDTIITGAEGYDRLRAAVAKARQDKAAAAD